MIKKYLYMMFVLAITAVSLTAPCARAAMLVDGMPSYTRGSDSGLYIWRSFKGVWQLRVMAGGGFKKFHGALESDQALKWVKHIGLETDDSAKQVEPGKLDVRLQVWKSGSDGLSFALAKGAGICLRSTGDYEATVYLGSGAVAATTPVDLTNSGACSNALPDAGMNPVQAITMVQEDAASVEPVVQKDASASTDASPGAALSPAVRKYNPGHYISMNRYDTQSDMINAIKPGVVGVQKRYVWSDLEPSENNYDFSTIQSDLDLLAGQGMRLVVFVEDKSFNGKIPTPRYLSDFALHNHGGGYTVKRWDPYVVSRMKALLDALGREFDRHPYLEGIAIQESAMSLNRDVLVRNGYDPAAYRDALIEVVSSAAFSFPTSQVFWYMNYLKDKQAYIEDIASVVAPLGVAMGGPDILPDSWSLKTLAYPYYNKYQGKMTLFGSMQYVSYEHERNDNSRPGKYWKMDEMFRFARDELHVEYIFWNRKNWRSPAGSYSWLDALDVIGRNPVI